jgi:hypothetical protein
MKIDFYSCLARNVLALIASSPEKVGNILKMISEKEKKEDSNSKIFSPLG